MYNILDDLVNDGVDALEKELLSLVRGGKGGAKRRGGVEEATLMAEISSVRDYCVYALLRKTLLCWLASVV